MAEEMSGGCACGKVRYTVRIHDDDAYLCHCRMCQRATGGVSIAFKNVKKADVDLGRGARLVPKLADRAAALLRCLRDSARLRLPGQREYGPHRRLVRRTGTFPAAPPFRRGIACIGNGSIPKACPRTAPIEYQPVVDRWLKAVGKVPD